MKFNLADNIYFSLTILLFYIGVSVLRNRLQGLLARLFSCNRLAFKRHMLWQTIDDKMWWRKSYLIAIIWWAHHRRLPGVRRRDREWQSTQSFSWKQEGIAKNAKIIYCKLHLHHHRQCLPRVGWPAGCCEKQEGSWGPRPGNQNGPWDSRNLQGIIGSIR